MANYGNTTDLTAYAAARGVTLTGDPATLLVNAHDYLESLSYRGYRTVSTQDDSWPRTGVVVDGVTLDSAAVPQRVIDAEYAQSIAIDQGNGAQNAITAGVKREKLGPLETEYQDGAISATIDTKTMSLLSPLLANGSGGSQFSVAKA